MSSLGISFAEFQAIQKNAFHNIFKDVSPGLAYKESFQLESNINQPFTLLSTNINKFSNSSSVMVKFSPTFNAKRANLEKVVENIKKKIAINNSKNTKNMAMGTKKFQNYQKIIKIIRTTTKSTKSTAS